MGVGMCLYAQLVQMKNEQCKMTACSPFSNIIRLLGYVILLK